MKIGEYEVAVVDNNTVKVGCVTVKRCEIKLVLDEMDIWKPQPKFKVGDFVRVLSGSDNKERTGEYGKVIEVGQHFDVGVEFPRRGHGHGLNRQVSDGHGWYFDGRYLELVD